MSNKRFPILKYKYLPNKNLQSSNGDEYFWNRNANLKQLVLNFLMDFQFKTIKFQFNVIWNFT